MIKLENTEVLGWEAAIRGMRNPMNSWERSDSSFIDLDLQEYHNILGNAGIAPEYAPSVIVGPNDHKLMMNLAKAGSVDAKYRRMIVATVDITAPLYWWKEFDTYKVGTVANSCSTMHKIHAKEFVLEDFSCEHLGYLDLDESRDKDEQKKDDDLSIEAFGMYPTDVLLQTISITGQAGTISFYGYRYGVTDQIPWIHASASGMKVRYNGKTYNLQKGWNRFSEIQLVELNNQFVVTGSGTVIIEVPEGRL